MEEWRFAFGNPEKKVVGSRKFSIPFFGFLPHFGEKIFIYFIDMQLQFIERQSIITLYMYSPAFGDFCSLRRALLEMTRVLLDYENSLKKGDFVGPDTESPFCNAKERDDGYDGLFIK